MSSINLEGIFFAIYVALRDADYADLLERAINFWEALSVVSMFIALALIAGIAYAKVRLSQVEEEDMALRSELVEDAAVPAEPKSTAHRAWEQVLEHAASENPNDWRLAIIEADILLDQLVEELGYVGDTLGERLRSASSTRFQSIDAAWEAHKVRNRIAHEGAAFQITHRETRRIIDLYRQVFEEFQHIPQH